VRAHLELRLLGWPTLSFGFTCDQFDVYHVNELIRAVMADMMDDQRSLPAEG
jgi:hypothetical protein